MSACSIKLIPDNIQVACEYVKSNCEYSYINFFAFHYCQLNNNLFLTIPIILILICISFYLLSDTTNKYLSPALTILSDKLNMSQNLAGVTFLALGNGAPDVISSIVASDDLAGIEYGIGSLIGAGVFVTCIVFSSVILFAGEVKIQKKLFIRDLILYLLSLSLLMVFSLKGEIRLYEAIGFFSLYILNVVFAIWQDKKGRNNIISNNKLENEMNVFHMRRESIVELFDNNNKDFLYDSDCSYELIAKKITKQLIESQCDTLGEKNNKLINKSLEDNQTNIASIEMNQSKSNERNMSISDSLREDHFYTIYNSTYNSDNRVIKRTNTLLTNIISFQYDSIKYRLKKNYFKFQEKKWENKGIIMKVIYIFIDLPFTFLRDITIPCVELERWNRTMFILIPFTSVIFLLLTLNMIQFITYDISLTIIITTFLLLVSILNCKYTYRNRLPKYISLVCIFSFIISIFWIWFVARILIDLLDLIGVLFNIPDSFLAMTLLSFGNSLPDLTLNCSLAKAGYGEMGIAGSIAGPLFNLLIGLGSSMIKKTIQTGPIHFNLFKYDHFIILIAIGVLAINLIRLLIQSVLLKFRLTKLISIIGYILYIVFIIMICLITFGFNREE